MRKSCGALTRRCSKRAAAWLTPLEPTAGTPPASRTLIRYGVPRAESPGPLTYGRRGGDPTGPGVDQSPAPGPSCALFPLLAAASQATHHASEAPELFAHFGVCRFAAWQSASTPGFQF